MSIRNIMLANFAGAGGTETPTVGYWPGHNMSGEYGALAVNNDWSTTKYRYRDTCPGEIPLYSPGGVKGVAGLQDNDAKPTTGGSALPTTSGVNANASDEYMIFGDGSLTWAQLTSVISSFNTGTYKKLFFAKGTNCCNASQFSGAPTQNATFTLTGTTSNRWMCYWDPSDINAIIDIRPWSFTVDTDRVFMPRLDFDDASYITLVGLETDGRKYQYDVDSNAYNIEATTETSRFIRFKRCYAHHHVCTNQVIVDGASYGCEDHIFYECVFHDHMTSGTTGPIAASQGTPSTLTGVYADPPHNCYNWSWGKNDTEGDENLEDGNFINMSNTSRCHVVSSVFYDGRGHCVQWDDDYNYSCVIEDCEQYQTGKFDCVLDGLPWPDAAEGKATSASGTGTYSYSETMLVSTKSAGGSRANTCITIGNRVRDRKQAWKVGDSNAAWGINDGSRKTHLVLEKNIFDTIQSPMVASFGFSSNAWETYGQSKVLQGDWDASSGSFPTTSTKGDYFNISGAGTVDGVSFAKGDLLIALIDSPNSTVFTGQWTKTSTDHHMSMRSNLIYNSTCDEVMNVSSDNIEVYLNTVHTAAGNSYYIGTTYRDVAGDVSTPSIQISIQNTSYAGNENTTIYFTLVRTGGVATDAVSVDWTVSNVTVSPSTNTAQFPIGTTQVTVGVVASEVTSNTIGTIALSNPTSVSGSGIVSIAPPTTADLTVYDVPISDLDDFPRLSQIAYQWAQYLWDGQQYIEYFTAAEIADRIATLGKFDFITVDFWTNFNEHGYTAQALTDALHAVNPSKPVRVLNYCVATEMQATQTEWFNYAEGQVGPGDWYNPGDPAADPPIPPSSGNHTWIARNPQGEIGSDYPGTFGLNITRFVTTNVYGDTAAQWKAQEHVDKVFDQNLSLDGAWIDVFNARPILSPLVDFNGDDQVDAQTYNFIENGTNDWYTEGQVDFYDRIVANRPNFIMHGNIGEWALEQARAEVPARYYGIFDGGLIEGLMMKDSDIPYYNYSHSAHEFGNFATIMNWYRDMFKYLRGPKEVMFHAGGSYTNYSHLRYCLCTCLLLDGYLAYEVAGPGDLVQFHHWKWFDEYNINLGQPIPNSVEQWNGSAWISINTETELTWAAVPYRRAFDNGMAVVNPKFGADPTSVTIDETIYKKFAAADYDSQDTSHNDGLTLPSGPNNLSIDAEDGFILIKI